MTDNWIPCSESLPEEPGRVLILWLSYRGEWVHDIAEWEPDSLGSGPSVVGRFVQWERNGECIEWKSWDVAYWMPLPPAPEATP